MPDDCVYLITWLCKEILLEVEIEWNQRMIIIRCKEIKNEWVKSDLYKSGSQDIEGTTHIIAY